MTGRSALTSSPDPNIECEMGMVFPPIGFLVFVVHRMAQDARVGLGHRITLVSVYWGIIPFVATAILVVLCLIQWPELVLWLPNRSAE
jgi:C4-dicarboxylate transporter DctM subunit